MTGRRCNVSLTLAILTVLGFAASRPAAAQTYTITDLGTLSGEESYAYSVNDKGEVVGQAQTGAVDSENVPIAHAFLWTPGGTDGVSSNPQMKDLGTLGGNYSIAVSINYGSTIVGSSSLSGNTTSHACRWWIDGYLRDLGTLGGTYSRAWSINDKDTIVGMATVAGGAQHAFLYHYRRKMTDLGTLTGGDYSVAYAVNNAGQVVGEGSKRFDVGGNWTLLERAFYYDPGAGMSSLDTLGGHNSQASSINDFGHVVGASETDTGETRAFLYNGDAMIDLGALGGSKSWAYHINASDQVVGEAETDSVGPNHAYVYDPRNGMQDLNSLIPPDSGWTLIAATGISDAGQIVGHGTIGGKTHAFLLTPAVSLASVTVAPDTVTGGESATGTVRLTGSLPFDVVLPLRFMKGYGEVQSTITVTIPAGATSATFPWKTSPVKTTQWKVIRGHYGGVEKSALLKVLPIGVASVMLLPNVVDGGDTVTCKVTLEYPAAPGKIVVTLTSSDPAVATVPASITIPAGKKSGTFTVTTSSVAALTTVTITAQAPEKPARTDTLKVYP